MKSIKKKKLVYLYSEIMGYNISIFKQLISKNIELHVFHWDHIKLSEYKHSNINVVNFYNRSEYDYKNIKKIVKNINPDILVISGWMDKDYLKVARNVKNKVKNIVCCIDNHWENSFKQLLMRGFLFKKFFNLHFSHAWIAGHEQYYFARKIGVPKKKIIFDLYSADTNTFFEAYKNFSKFKIKNYPKNLIYVGRFSKEKGLSTLIKAWKSLDHNLHEWTLTLIGSGGDYVPKVSDNPNINIKGFLQPDQLVDYIKESGCFILPSSFEPWGVVVHEFACAGLPLLLSNEIGSKNTFLLPGVNGYQFEAGNVQDLKEILEKIIILSDSELIKMGNNSNKLSKRITTESSTNSLLSIIN